MVVGKSPERPLPDFTEKVKYMNERTIKESEKTNDSPNWLPDGWTTEERARNSDQRRGAAYNVYTEVSSGKRFYSKASVTQYLGDCSNAVTVQTKLDKVDEPSPKCISTTNTGGTLEEEKKNNSVKMLDKVDDPSPPEVFRKEVDGLPKQQQSDVDPSIESSSTSFSDMGNFGFMYCNVFNNHSSTDVGKNDGQTKLNP